METKHYLNYHSSWLNRVTRGSIILFALLLCSVHTGFSVDYEMTQISPRDGLPQADVKSIDFDKNGLIWVSTYEGIARYNGYDFENFPLYADGNLATQTRTVKCDNDGNVWIVTMDYGLFVYSSSKERMIHLSSQLEGFDDLRTTVYDVEVDPESGDVWIVGLRGAIYRVQSADFERQKYDIKYYPTPNGDLPPANPSDVIMDEENRLCFVKNKYTYRYNPTTDSIELLLPELTYGSKTMGSYGGRIYFSKWEGLYSVKEGEDDDAVLEHCDMKNTHFYITKRGMLWIFGNQGIYYQDLSSGANSPMVKFSDRSFTVYTVVEDANGNVIVGTLREGMLFIKRRFKSFDQYLSGVTIDALHEGSKGEIYTGGVDGSVRTLYPQPDGRYRVGDKVVKATTGNIVSLCPNPFNKELILGLSGASVTVKGDKVEYFDEGEQTFYGPTFRVFIDSTYCYQASYTYGLIVSDARSHKLLGRYHSGSESLKLPSNIVRNVFKDSKDNLWIATAEGLVRVSAESRFSNTPMHSLYRHSKGDSGSLSSNYIIPIQEDLKGNIWVGTLGGGVNCLTFDDEANLISNKIYNTANGLSNDMIKSIEVDDRGKVWVATNRGLNCINPLSGKINIYTPSDGVQDYEFGELSSVKLSSGMLAFGGVNGVSIFDPERISTDAIAPEVVISELLIWNKRVMVDQQFLGEKILTRSISETDELQLPKKFNSFSFNFTSTNSANPRSNTYTYMLEGFDRDWITTPATNRTARYTNIPPGEYRFVVKAANNDGVWSRQRAINIKIAYPTLASPVAFIVYFILVVLMIYLYLLDSKRRQQRQTEITLARLEKQQLRELSESKLNFFSNISHEFRTPLTLIMSTVQLLKGQARMSSDQRLRYVNIINHNSSILMHLINELLDVAKFDNGQLDVSLQRVNVVELAEQTFAQFGGWMEQSKISGSFSSSKSELISMVDTHKMEEIIYNIMSNAIKHTPQNGEISMRMRSEDASVVIEIFNSCDGIAEKEVSHLFERFYTKSSDNKGYGIGLALTKSLVELHDGTVSCSSESGRGVTLTVTIPIVSEESIVEEVEEVKAVETVEAESQVSEVPTSGVQLCEVTPDTEQSQGGVNILVVDDNQAILTLLSEILSPHYGVTTTTEPKEALDIALASTPSLIISDVMMEGMSGVELCKELKSNKSTSHIPIILLSAKGSNEAKIKGMKARADAYVVKPFDNDLLLSQIGSLLKNRASLSSRFNIAAIDEMHAIDKEADYELVTRTLELVKENVSNPELNVDFLCRTLGVCQITLNKRLKKYNNKTAIGFIRSIRMNYAAAMLDSGRYTIAEVTYAVGLSDLRHFRESFSKEFGMLPSEYMNRR